jgi:hypothetical protein
LLEGSKRTSRDVRGPAAGRADALDEAHCPTHVRASKLQRFGLLRGSGGCGKTSCAGFKVFSKIAPDSNEIGVSCAGFTVFFEIALDSNQKKCLRRIPILLRWITIFSQRREKDSMLDLKFPCSLWDGICEPTKESASSHCRKASVGEDWCDNTTTTNNYVALLPPRTTTTTTTAHTHNVFEDWPRVVPEAVYIISRHKTPLPVGSLPPLRDQRFVVTISLSHHVTIGARTGLPTRTNGSDVSVISCEQYR